MSSSSSVISTALTTQRRLVRYSCPRIKMDKTRKIEKVIKWKWKLKLWFAKMTLNSKLKRKLERSNAFTLHAYVRSNTEKAKVMSSNTWYKTLMCFICVSVWLHTHTISTYYWLPLNRTKTSRSSDDSQSQQNLQLVSPVICGLQIYGSHNWVRVRVRLLFAIFTSAF